MYPAHPSIYPDSVWLPDRLLVLPVPKYTLLCKSVLFFLFIFSQPQPDSAKGRCIAGIEPNLIIHFYR
jgi:hypothetical protein